MSEAIFSTGEPDAVRGVASPRPWFPRSFVVTDRVAGLERIFDDAVSVCVWRRGIDQVVDRFLEKGMPATFERRMAHVSCDRPRFDELLGEIGSQPGGTEFLAELQSLLELFASLADCSMAGVRILSGTARSCPRFHVDHVGLRMVCTWRGPGTEWLEHEAVERRFLNGTVDRPPDETSGLLRRGAQIYQAKPFDVVVLKGDLWPNNQGRAAVHRSPWVPPQGTPRVRVTFDAM
jgi:hypothetical protein